MAEEDGGILIPAAVEVVGVDEGLAAVGKKIEAFSEKAAVQFGAKMRRGALEEALKPAREQAKALSINVPVKITSVTKASLKTSVGELQKEIDASKPVTVALGLRRVSSNTPKIGLNAVVEQTQVQVDQYKKKVTVPLALGQPNQATIDSAITKLRASLENKVVDVKVRPVVAPAAGGGGSAAAAAKEELIVENGRVVSGKAKRVSTNPYLRESEFTPTTALATKSTYTASIPERRKLLEYKATEKELNQRALEGMTGYVSPEIQAANKMIDKAQWDMARDLRKRSIQAEIQAMKPVDFVGLGHQMTRAGHQAMWTTTLPAMLAGGLAINEYKNFDTQMGMIGSLTNTKASDMPAVRSGLLNMAGNGNRFDPTQLGQGYQQIAHFSNDVAENMKVLAASAKAASTGIGTVESVSEVVTSALNSYGGTAKDATRYTDIIIKMAQEGKGKVEQYGTALGRVMPIASSLGISLPEVAANISIGTRIGMSPQESANGLRRVMTAIANPSSEGGKLLQKMGFNPNDLVDTIKKQGFGNLLVDINKKAGGSSTVMGTIFGSIRALTQELAVAGKQADAYKQLIHDMSNAQGTVTRAQLEANKTLSASMDIAVAKIKATSNALMEDLAPSLTHFVEGAEKVITSGMEHATTLAKLHPDLAKGAGLLGAAVVAAPVGLTVAGSVLQGVAELGKVGVTFKSSLIPAAALAGVAMETFATSADNSSNKLNQAIQTWIAPLMMAPAAYKMIGAGGQMLMGRKAIGDPSMAGYIAANPGLIKKVRGFIGDLGARRDLMREAYLNPVGYQGEATGLRRLAGVLNGTAIGGAVEAGTIGMSGLALASLPIAVAGGLGYAAWAQNQKAQVLSAEVNQYNQGILKNGVDTSFSNLEGGIQNNLSGTAQASVEARVANIKQAYNKAVSEGDTALLESTTNQIQKLMGDIKIRSDIDDKSKSLINGFLAKTFDKTYKLKIQINSEGSDINPTSHLGLIENWEGGNTSFLGGYPGAALGTIAQSVVQLFGGGHSNRYGDIGAQVLSDRAKAGWWKSTFTSPYTQFQNAIEEKRAEASDLDRTKARNASRIMYGDPGTITKIKDMIQDRWKVGAADDVAKMNEKQLLQLKSYYEKTLIPFYNKKGINVDPNTLKVMMAVYSRLGNTYGKKGNATPLNYDKYGTDKTGGGYVPQPRLSKIAGDMDGLINGILSFGNKTDEATMRLELLKAASENLSKSVQDAALQLAKYSDQQKALEQRKNLTSGFLDNAYNGYLQRGILPGSNPAIKHLEKFIDYKGGNERLQSMALRANSRAQSGGGLIINETGTGRGSIASSLMEGSAIGDKIAQSAVDMQATAKNYSHRCEALLRVTTQKVTHNFDKFFAGSAAKTLSNFKSAGIGHAADGTYHPGDMVYTGSSVGKGYGHAQLVGPDGYFYDQYGRHKKPTTTPEWVVSPGGTGNSNSVSARQMKADMKSQAIALGQFNKLQSLKPGSFSDAISLFSQTPEWMKKAFGGTKEMMNDPSSHQNLAGALKLLFGSEDAVKVVKEKGKQWGIEFIKSIVAAAKQFDLDFMAADLRREIDKSAQMWQRKSNQTAHANKTLTDLVTGGGRINSYALAQNQLGNDIFNFNSDQKSDKDSVYNHILQRDRSKLGWHRAQQNADAWLATQDRQKTLDFNQQQYAIGEGDIGSMIGGFQSSRELSAASMKAYSSAKSRQAADRALEMARLTQQFKEDTEKKNQPTSGSAYDKALSDFLRQGGTSYDAQLRLRNAGEAFDYAQGFSSQHKMSGAALRALSSDNGIIGQYGATSQFAIKNAGQDAVNARKAEIAQLQLTNKLVADMTPEQEKQVRQDAEMAASAKQKNDWLQTQLQTTKQIALEDKQRANARSVSRLGLPSELAAAELERRSAKDSLDNDRSVNGMTPEDYKQRLAEINRKYSDVKNNYTSDSAQSFLNSNIGQRNDLMAQAAMPVGDTGYLAQAKQEIYQLEHQTDAYGKAIGKALDPKYKDAILEQATAMDTYAKSIDTATQRWMAQKGVVDDINSAIQTGITDWRAGIKELGDDVMKMATGSISSYLTSKLLPHNQEAKDLRSNSMNAVGAFSDLVSGRSGGTSKARTVSGLAGSGVFFGAGSGFNSAVFPSLPTWVPNMQSAASNQYSMMAGLIPGAGGSGQMNASTVIVNGTNVNVNGSGIGAALTAGSSPMSTSQGFAGFAAMLIPSMVGGGSTSSLNGGTWV